MISIGALVALLSLRVTASMVASGIVSQSWAISGVTNTTPIVVTTSAPHKVPPGYKMHAVVSGVAGTTNANGAWELSVRDETSFTLGTYSGSGANVPSVGNGVYAGGGTIATVLDEGAILLGRKYLDVTGAPPRIVFVPTTAPLFDLQAAGGMTMPLQSLPSTLAQMTPEQVALAQQPPLLTDHARFEVYVWGAALPGAPNFADFDVTRALRDEVIVAGIDLISSPMFKILGGRWDSQVAGATQSAWSSQGQAYMMLVEIWMPVVAKPFAFVPFGVSATLRVQPANPAPDDPIVIEVGG
jgi:hypothetical protein